MVREWIYNEITDLGVIETFAGELKISPLLSGILYRKGITNIDSARAYFKPALSELHNPFLMKDMDKAVERLKSAVENNEKILVYGDYDVDGTTSVGMMTLFLHNLTPNIDYYIPDRYTEGYGISEAGVRYAIKGNFGLIICLDCGIRANKNVKYAFDNDIDFIICDHHLPGNELPVAKAVLDPKRSDCGYPFKELSGCGIGFKLIQAYGLSTGISDKNIFQYLDLVAVSICADIVPITGENRILTYYGLRKLNLSPLTGLAGLIRATGRRRTFKVSDVVFGIAPRINAAGRMKHAREAVQLLLADTEENVEKGANRLNEMNAERRSRDQETTQEAMDMIQQSTSHQNASTTVLYNESWNKGIIGIVASRLIEHYYRPTIILTQSNGMATGSARSVKGFNVFEAISACGDLLVQFGGHKYAAGLTMELDNIQHFMERFETVVSSTINKNDLIPKIYIDAKINFDEIDLRFFGIMERMEPFGPGNPVPTFVSEDVFCKSARIVGENHLKMFLAQNGVKNKFEAIAFKMGEFEKEVSSKKPFNIAFHLELNDFQNEKSLQLVVKDMKFKD